MGLICGLAIASGLTATLSSHAQAVPGDEPFAPVNRYQLGGENSGNKVNQITSVAELRDVQPNDWAFAALQSLVERYGCIVGYPDRTYRGDAEGTLRARALSRYEFAAALNACLNTIEQLLQANVSVVQGDLDLLKKLAQDFQAELKQLAVRVDNLATRTAFLENHQFSTTTKLYGQTIVSFDDVFGDRVGGDRNEFQPQLAYRVRFNLETSFTGKDLLRTRLQFSNFFNGVAQTGTNMTRFNYDDNSNNNVEVTHLWYRTPLTDNLTLRLGSVGVGYTDLVDTLTPPTIADDALGIPSRFGEYDPIYRRGGGGAGLNWQITPTLQLSAGYLATNPNDPDSGNGLFNGGHHALGQLAYQTADGGIGFTYSRSYFPAGETNLMAGTGSFLAIQPFGEAIATAGDFYTLQGYYRITPHVQLHAWGGYVDAQAQGGGMSNLADGVGGTVLREVSWNRSAIWYGLLGISFPDVGGEGNLPGIALGIPPTVTASNLPGAVGQTTPYHLETFYRIQINDNISITPGFWVVLNPEANSNNATQYVGHIRTSFLF
ncbi:iron uptake porin [Synechocystis sp. PCC 7339]|uniref:iron uptake porin n=1 Tax=Synechocystis sp. PCC 7339 TaxID=2782213 RepID=UPI001CC06D10|nr:iron uptake porin [Synechocystis sp. PCC 7339]UAJ74468.1 iron uptake porin [Synechocystis sp. PCC 7339]